MNDNRMKVQGEIQHIKDVMVGYLYRHFKGGLYVVTDIAVHSETEEPMVIYRSYNDPSLVWCRPLSMFLSEVDHEKYPDVKQLMRFERIGETDLMERTSIRDLERDEKTPTDAYDKAMSRKRGERLRAFRHELGYNQSEFAVKLNEKIPSERGRARASSTISNIENAKAGKEMTTKMAMDLGKTFGIRWEYFYCIDDFRTQKEYENYISEKHKSEESGGSETDE